MNEIGFDPGIDHMLAMQCFDEVHSKGGKVCSRGRGGEERSAHEGRGEGRKGLLTREEGKGGKVCSRGRRGGEERSAHDEGGEGRKCLLMSTEGREGREVMRGRTFMIM